MKIYLNHASFLSRQSYVSVNRWHKARCARAPKNHDLKSIIADPVSASNSLLDDLLLARVAKPSTVATVVEVFNCYPAANVPWCSLSRLLPCCFACSCLLSLWLLTFILILEGRWSLLLVPRCWPVVFFCFGARGAPLLRRPSIALSVLAYPSS